MGSIMCASPADAAAPLVPEAAAVPELRARLRAALDPHGVLDRGTWSS